MRRHYSTIEQALEAVAAGRPVLVVDAEDRENEGDFVVAAERVTPSTIHFLISEGRGQLCMPVTPKLSTRLAFTPMVGATTDDALPGFCVPVDHRMCKTGISPLERALTILAILDPESRPEDFIRPGHIFPLVARPGGLLERTGHTEATVDLTRMAGMEGAGVLCEICSRDGVHMAGRDELFEIATEFGLDIVTIEDIIAYRRKHAETGTLASTVEMAIG